MARRPRRNHSPAFKAKAALKGEQTLAGGMAGVFEDGAKAKEPEIDVKTLHAKIGQLTLENNFLSGALGKAGLMVGAKK